MAAVIATLGIRRSFQDVAWYCGF